MGKGKLIDELFSELVQPELIQPTFVMDFPVEMSPLCKKHREMTAPDRAFRTVCERLRSGECVQRIERPDRSARTLRRAAEVDGTWR